MSIVNTRDKTIVCKVVYCGPGLGGKTTSLKAVHDVLDPERKVKLISLKTDEERTLFFDFLPIDLGMVGGYRIKLQAFTVPGQVKYNLTRKYVLMGADGVVFVADSQRSREAENVESLENVSENLAANGLDPFAVPLVMQYNKRDLEDVLPVEDLDARLNPRKLPSFATTAATGEGVFDAFTVLARLTIEQVVRRYGSNESPNDVGNRAVRYLNSLSGARA